MTFGAEDMQTAQLGDAFTQFDVRTASGHVGGDGHTADLTRLRDDFGFTGMLLGVQHIVGNALLAQHGGKKF